MESTESTEPQGLQPLKITYTRQELLDLAQLSRIAGSRRDIPAEILRKRRRGTRAGTKRKQKRRAFKRTFKPALPTVIMGNVRSLNNKTEELESLVRSQNVYRDSCLLCFTETWLKDCIPEQHTNFTGFLTIRSDRDSKACGKRSGGGIALLVNNRWCNPKHATIKERICNKDIELLAVSLRPYYLPREFTVVVAIVVYIPPSAHAETACDVVHTVVARLQAKYPDSVVFVTGDFNHVSLSKTLPTFKQSVNCTTRGDKTLDLFYSNVKDSHNSTALPPLGGSDHNLVFLSPTYTHVVKRLPAATKTIKNWTDEAKESLQCRLDLTDWDVFCDSYGDDIDGLTDCVTDYINGAFPLHSSSSTRLGFTLLYSVWLRFHYN